jgi:hypothetical protein
MTALNNVQQRSTKKPAAVSRSGFHSNAAAMRRDGAGRST